MKRFILFLMQVLMALSLVFAVSCDEGNGGKIPSGGLKIGQSYQGGKVLYVDDTGKHGLIAAPSDEMGLYTWDEAIAVCKEKVLKGYDDWYLPSKGELQELYLNRNIIGGFTTGFYWSSSEVDTKYAWCQYFSSGVQYGSNRGYTYGVRAVRAF